MKPTPAVITKVILSQKNFFTTVIFALFNKVKYLPLYSC